MQTASNPLREGLSNRAQTKPCALVIFGATGDLTHRKLIPALYNLAGRRRPAARHGRHRLRPAREVRRGLPQGNGGGHQEILPPARATGTLGPFRANLYYHRSAFDDDAGYNALAERIGKLDKENTSAGGGCFTFRRDRSSSSRSSRGSKRAASTNPARKAAGRARSSKNPSARTSPARGTSTASSARRSRNRTPTASTISSARKRRRTSWCCVLPTPSSSRSGTAATSITSRSRRRKPSASRRARGTTRPAARCATWCRTISSNS